jgi:sortase A
MARWLERALWLVAIAAMTVYSGTFAERSLSQAYFNWEFARTLDAPPRADPANHVIPYSAQPLGRIEIPAIDLSAIFVEGIDNRVLRLAVGHIPGTALPGTLGNVGLAGHRDTFFRKLGKLRSGDMIWLATPNGRYKYLVESLRIVDSDEAIVLQAVGRSTLTLVTCYPFYYVGPAPRRFVVHAGLVRESP